MRESEGTRALAERAEEEKKKNRTRTVAKRGKKEREKKHIKEEKGSVF